VCVFEGLTYARTVAQTWYAARLSEGAEGEKARDADRRRGREGRAMEENFPTSPARARHTVDGDGDDDADADANSGRGSDTNGDTHAGPSRTLHAGNAGDAPPRRPSPRPTFSYSRPSPDDASLSTTTALHPLSDASASAGGVTPPSVALASQGNLRDVHFRIHVSAPIVDRKSTFIGHAVRVTDEREVPLVIHEILSDKKVARAAHPAMFAYRIAKEVGGVAGRVVLAGECGFKCGFGVRRVRLCI
jgi:hypothetical protein